MYSCRGRGRFSVVEIPILNRPCLANLLVSDGGKVEISASITFYWGRRAVLVCMRTWDQSLSKTEN